MSMRGKGDGDSYKYLYDRCSQFFLLRALTFAVLPPLQISSWVFFKEFSSFFHLSLYFSYVSKDYLVFVSFQVCKMIIRLSRQKLVPPFQIDQNQIVVSSPLPTLHVLFTDCIILKYLKIIERIPFRQSVFINSANKKVREKYFCKQEV